ncbi:MAG: hypothetical protein HY690_06300 [Chloroflexi bacterium]|nr:hypothetical protein [Chloroflexota bacterium]
MAHDPNYSREQFERDLDQALRQAGADKLPPARRRWRSAGLALDLRPASPGQVMLAGGILVALQWLGLAFFLHGLAGTLGLALLGFGFLGWLLRPRRHEAYWRGRRIEWDEGPTWLERLYYCFYRH